MNDKKGWGATVLGWFVVSDDEEGARPRVPTPAATRAASLPARCRRSS